MLQTGRSEALLSCIEKMSKMKKKILDIDASVRIFKLWADFFIGLTEGSIHDRLKTGRSIDDRLGGGNDFGRYEIRGCRISVCRFDLDE